MQNSENDDPFDSISSMNSKAYSNGYTEGIIMGKRAALVEGFKIGKNTALNLGNEIGQYYSCCLLYKNKQHQLSNNVNQDEIKQIKLAAQIVEMIENFDLNDCHNEKFPIYLNQIRDKFKQFCSLTSVKNYVASRDKTSKTQFDF